MGLKTELISKPPRLILNLGPLILNPNVLLILNLKVRSP